MNKHQNSITEPSIKSLFENKNFAFVGTSLKDGSPHVTPTWVDIEDNYILINTAIGRVKQKNVARDPRVSVSIADMNNPYHMVTVNGEIVEQIKGEEAEKHIDKLAKKYLNKDKYPGRAPGEERILLKIKPKKVVHMK